MYALVYDIFAEDVEEIRRVLLPDRSCEEVETSPGMGGVEGARSALRHHFLAEKPDSICPTDGQEVLLVMKGRRGASRLWSTRSRLSPRKSFTRF